MKKLLSLLFVCLTLNLSLFAQEKPQITHGDFEDGWKQIEGYKNSSSSQKDTLYWEFTKSNHLRTLNELKEVPPDPPFFGPGPSTAEMEKENPGNGYYSIKLVTDTFRFGNDLLIIPGALGTITIRYETMDASITDVFPSFDDRPLSLRGIYKYKPVTYTDNQWANISGIYKNKAVRNDYAKFEIRVLDLDGNTIGEGLQTFFDETSNYVDFSIPINYKPNNNKEIDSITIIFAASGGYNFEDLFNCKGNKGSTLWLDDIYLDYESVSVSLIKSLEVQVFPNPASDQITFNFEKELQANLVIYDVLGREVLNQKISGNQTVANIQHLESGNYLYRIIDNRIVLKSGKITKK